MSSLHVYESNALYASGSDLFQRATATLHIALISSGTLLSLLKCCNNRLRKNLAEFLYRHERQLVIIKLNQLPIKSFFLGLQVIDD